MNELIQKLKEFGRVKIKEPLMKYTTYRVGGPAEYFLIVEDAQKMPDLLNFLSGEGLPYLVLGGGSNILFLDEGFDGVLIKMEDRRFTINGELVSASAGAIVAEIADATIRAGLTGFEWGVGLPGTIGGAIRGNAGIPGGEMCDSVESVRVWENGEEAELNNAECKFGYRDSIFKHSSMVVVVVKLRLTHGENVAARQKALSYIMNRAKTQPQGVASAGCAFKNVLREKLPGNFVWPKELPESDKIPAGWLIDQCGLKGEKIGGAVISEKHANFILNSGEATAGDIIGLIALIKEKVYNKFGIELEEEVFIVK